MSIVERRTPLALAGVVAALFGLRVSLVLGRTGPVLFADESGYLGAARLLAGGEPYYMGSSPFYRPGYALLLAPVFRLGLSPAHTYVLVLVLNAALAASLVPLLYLLLRRNFGLSAGAALAGAVVGAAYPSVTAGAAVATSENLLYPLLVVWLLAFGGLLRARGVRAVLTGAATGACAAAMWAVHGRMIVVLAVTALGLVALGLRRRVSAAAAAVGLGVLAVGLVLVHLLDVRVAAGNYGGRAASSEYSSALRALDDPADAGAVVRALLGTAWYLLVASFGLVLVVLADGRDVLRRLRHRAAGRAEVTAGLLLAVLAGLLLVSAVWLFEATRADHLVYGRYAEPVLPALLALAVGRLTTRGRAPRLVAILSGLAVLTAAVAVLRSQVDFPGEYANRWSVASAPFFTMDLGPAVLVVTGLVAGAGAAVIGWTALRRPGVVWLVVLALFVPVTAVSQTRLVQTTVATIYPAGWEDPAAAVSNGGNRIAYDTAHFDRITIKVVQYFAPRAQLLPFDGATTPAPSTLVLSGSNWSREHSDRPATALWRDLGRDQVLWQLGN